MGGRQQKQRAIKQELGQPLFAADLGPELDLSPSLLVLY